MKKRTSGYYVGIDVGGTKICAVLLDAKFRVLSRTKHKWDVHGGEKVFFQTIQDTYRELLKTASVLQKKIVSVGVGCAGMIQFPQGIVQLSPNIAFMKRYPFQTKLSKALGVPVVIENDVNAGLYGEHQLGCAVGFSHVVGIFPGTGVGGALILNNDLYRGATGVAGEVGHMFMNMDGLVYGGNQNGTLEALVGRTTISAEAARLAMKQQASALFKKYGTDPRKIKSGALSYAVRSGDEKIREMLLYKARVLGLSMASLANIINPEMIVLGGGLIEAVGDLMVPEAARVMKEFGMKPNVAGVKVKAAVLKDDAVAVGAAKLSHDVLTGK